MKKFSSLLSAFLLIALFSASVPRAEACGPSFTIPVFAFNSRADSFDRFAAGELGVVKPYFNRSFLFVAYRYFNNAPLTANEQDGVESIWRAQYDDEEITAIETYAAVNDWKAARKKILPTDAEPKIYTERAYGGGYDFFPNCTKNAFEIATTTLADRAAKHGATNADVQNWTRAQDQVFSNCSEGKAAPAEAEATVADWLKNDRAYQIAAAEFYAANFEAARTKFETIAANPNSVWRNTANYLVARTLIRQASLDNTDYYSADEAARKEIEARSLEFYRRAETQLNRIVTDQNQSDFHQAARKLLNLIAYRTRSTERQHELAQTLIKPGENPNLRLDLIDYTWLLNKNSAANKEAAEKAAQEAAQKAGKEYDYNYRLKATDLPKDARADDLTDWIFTMQTVGDQAVAQYAAKKWQDTNAPHWFAAALSSADKNSQQIERLISQAEKVEKTSPLFATVAFHQVRLLSETGKTTEARQKLDRILNDKTLNLPPSARNDLLRERAKAAQSLDEFLTFAQRRAVAFAVDGSPYLVEDLTKKPANDAEDYLKDERLWSSRMMFDDDSVVVFNQQMPLSMLKEAAQNQRVPDYLKRNLLVAAWTRAVLLDNELVARELAANLVAVAPEFKPVLQQYLDAAEPTARTYAATYSLLKLPALRPFVESGYGRLAPVAEIDSYRDNWWCAPENQTANQANSVELQIAPAFITDVQRAEARRELDQIAKLGDSATYLARRAVEFGTRSSDEPRAPEALSLAVRATRYGCTDCSTGRFSKAAHDLLKKNYPTSDYAKKTPYWFKDESCDVQK